MSDGSAGAHPDGRQSRGPSDEVLREQWRRERRALVRRHHPDIGGDPDVLQARLAALDHRYRVRESALTEVPAVLPEPLHRPWLVARRLARQLSATVRSRVPVHRRRRYFEI